MRLKAALTVAFIVGTISTPLRADWLNGNQLKNHCEIDTEFQIGKAICLGYIQGVSDAQTTIIYDAKTLKPENPPPYCVPRTATGKQLIAVVLKYLNENPEKLHWSASSLIFNAMHGAFPC